VERSRAANERLRLLYVACTRAKERLHLVGVAQCAEDGLKPPRYGTLLAALWPALEAEFAAALPAAQGRAPAAPDAAARGGRPPVASDGLARGPGGCLPADWAMPPLPASLAAGPVAGAAPPEETVVYDWAGPRARLVGKAVHALLRQVALQGFGAWPAAVDARSAAAERALTGEGLFGEPLEAAIDDVVQAVSTALMDPRGRWVLGPQRDAQAEWELTHCVGQRAQRMIVDRTFVDEQGRRWVIDYKTGTHSGSGRDHFLDSELERHRPQLERYAKALATLDPVAPVRCGLYFPLAPSEDGLGGWREWPFSPLAAPPQGPSE